MTHHAVTAAKLAVSMGALEPHCLWSICLYGNPASSTSLHVVTVNQKPVEIWADGREVGRSHSVVLKKCRYTENQKSTGVVVHCAG